MPKIPTSSGPQVFIGIDPGQKGGLVALFSDGSYAVTPMPQTEREVWEWFDELFSVGRGIVPKMHAVIEKVHAMPKQGVTSMFTFGYGFGGLKMALIAAGIPFEEIQPRAWQKSLGVPSKKKEESAAQFKTRLLKMAQQLFPSLELWREKKAKGKMLAVADALLIAEYCRRKQEGRL